MPALPRDVSSVGITQAQLDHALAESAAVKRGVREKAEAVRSYWQSIAPVDDSYRGAHLTDDVEVDSGDYTDSIEIQYRTGKDRKPYARVGSRLMPLARWVEYGSSKNQEYGYARQVKDQFGLEGSTADKVAELVDE
jgi:hypothetical protein